MNDCNCDYNKRKMRKKKAKFINYNVIISYSGDTNNDEVVVLS